MPATAGKKNKTSSTGNNNSRVTSLKVETVGTSSTQSDSEDVAAVNAIANATGTATATSATQQHQQLHVLRSTETTATATTPRDFSNPADFPYLTVRHVNLAQRSAFAGFLLPQEQQPSQSNTTASTNAVVSPPPNYVRLLHRLQDNPVVRQLQFSPSTGPAADVLFAAAAARDANSHGSGSSSSSSRSSTTCTDSNNVQAGQVRVPSTTSTQSITMASSTAATMLPQQQQASTTTPRTVTSTLVSSSSTGTTTTTTPPPFSTPRYPSIPIPPLHPRILQHGVTPRCWWHRLPHRADVGFAHPDPDHVTQKQREVHHESLCAEHEGPRLAVHIDVHSERVQQHVKAKTTTPTTSVLAPPWSATYSPSQGWRPRPLHDRPAGLQYCCAVIAAAPPQCTSATVTLYTLPPLYREKHVYAAAAAAAYHCRNVPGGETAWGKISDDVVVRLQQQPSAAADGGASGTVPTKVLLSYHMADLLMESSTSSSSSSSNGGAASPEQQPLPHSLYVVVQFRTLHGTPHSFGVTKFFSKLSSAATASAGQSKDIGMYRYSSSPMGGAAAAGSDTTTTTSAAAAFTNDLWRVVHQKYTGVTPEVVGRARLWLCAVGPDVLQCLLHARHPIGGSKHTTNHNNNRASTRALLDPSGEQCVALERATDVTAVHPRSSLLRVPARTVPMVDHVEALYLPPTQLHNHPTVGMRNLLLLAPRRVRRIGERMDSNGGGDDQGEKDTISCAVRVRCLRGDTAMPVPCFPTPAGKAEAMTTASATGNAQTGIVWRDEFKMNVPTVLDGSYRLEFSLLHVGVVSTTTIPLSSVTAGSAARIVIPNGKHRVELGAFQLQLETRLLSSIHTGDPAVAAVLSDLPWDKPNTFAKTSPGSSSATGGSRFSETALSKASASTLVEYFSVLLNMHLAGLLESSCSSISETPPTTILYSLMDLLRRVKVKLVSTPTRANHDVVAVFIKQHLDLFDEAVVSDRLNGVLSLEAIQETANTAARDREQEEDVQDDDSMTDYGDDDSIMSLSKSARWRNSSRSSRKRGSETPFSRVAFGASKLDRMRAEAELQHDNSQHFSPYFEDDETIATTPSLYSERRRHNTPRSILTVDTSATNTTESTRNSRRTGGTKNSQNLDERLRSIGDTEFAKRVKTAASAMLAPCVAPTLSMLRQAAPKSQSDKEEGGAGKMKSLRSFGVHCLCSPGSDLDMSLRGERNLESMFRGQIDPPVLAIPTGAPGRRNQRSLCVYESIMRMWIVAWEDYMSAENGGLFPVLTAPEQVSAKPLAAFLDNIDFFLPLCLKSISMRYQGLVSKRSIKTKVILDDAHHALFGLFFEVLAKCLVEVVVTAPPVKESAITPNHAVNAVEFIADFLIGLSAMVHPEFIRSLLSRFLETLKTTDTGADVEGDESAVLSAMELRLAFGERIAALPCFLALNYPPKYNGNRATLGDTKVSWLSQYHTEQTGNASKSSFNSADSFLPPSGWLGKITVDLFFGISAEALRYMHKDDVVARDEKGTFKMKTDTLSALERISTRASMAIHQLVVRKNAMDSRFQNESARYRVAAVLATPILDVSVVNASVLAKLDPRHPVRCSWLLAVMYILQEAPETLICYFVSWCCEKGTNRLPKFVKLLELCVTTFHSPLTTDKSPFVVYSTAEGEIGPWLRQECFNTICAAANSVVDVCSPLLSSRPDEYKRMMKCTAALFLRILSIPHSAVTCSRIVGGSLQTLESNIGLFTDCVGPDLQHWARVLYSKMNSTSLSVRSIAVDFMVSLFGGLFSQYGNIDAPVTVFCSVLPECVAREVAMYSTLGYINERKDIEKAIWPLRRSLADFEDSDPADDNRVDAQLSPVITLFCRTNQAIIDGVLLEMNLHKNESLLIPSHNEEETSSKTKGVFDADEESLFEAASFFKPEVAPLQRVRWFLALSRLQESKSNFVEAAEASFLIALTICDAIPHVNQVWRPSRFAQWSQDDLFAWQPQQSKSGTTEAVSSFAAQYLEPETFLGVCLSTVGANKLARPTVSAMCSLLTRTTKEAVRLYLLESGMEHLAYNRLESLLKMLMSVIENHESQVASSGVRTSQYSLRKRFAQEEASLRGVVGGISAEMTKLAEVLVALVEEDAGPNSLSLSTIPVRDEPRYVVVRLYGSKPPGFFESTTVPPFIVWEKPCVCRLPASRARGKTGKEAATIFATPLVNELKAICGPEKVEMRTSENFLCKDGVTYIDVLPVSIVEKDPFDVSVASLGSKRFFRKRDGIVVETTVAYTFPCALSRQSSLLTTEISSTKAQGLS